MRASRFVFLSIVIGAGAVVAPAADLTLDQILGIRHPSAPVFAPDGSRVVFVWDRAGVQNLYAVEDAGAVPVALTSFGAGLVGPPFLSTDGKTVYFEKDGDLWSTALVGGTPAPLWKTADAEGDFSRSPDGSRVAFVRDGDVFVRSLADGTETRLTKTPEPESGPEFSPDGKRVAFGSTRGTPRQESPAYNGSKLMFSRFEFAGTAAGIVPSAGGAPAMVEAAEGSLSAPRWLDPDHVVLERLSPDVRTREILVAEAGTGKSRALHTDVDEKFWSLTFLGAEPLPSPDGKWVAFISDRDGWDRLYVVSSAGGDARALTPSGQEVSDPSWSPDSGRLVFDLGDKTVAGRRQIGIVDIRTPDAASLRTLTSGPGARTYPRFSPDGVTVLYQATGPRDSADLYVAATDGPPRRLTDSLGSIDRDGLIPPQFVRYRSADGAEVPAYLFVPKNLDRAKKAPAIIWVHGDGITQNYEGWHIRRDYAVYHSFHQYLAQRGYVVLAVDYRGSIGYGKAWRQGHYRDIGGKDYEDIAAGVEYMKTLGYVDTDRVGVWGLSYGGFMALQALTVTPRLFACAIDVAGVHDWTFWFKDPGGPWIKARLDSPQANPELYHKLSPVNFLDRVERPLLVLHGTADVNVPFLESVHLIDELMKKGKTVDFAMYPGEFHYFHRAHVLRDAWSRVEAFFAEHLRGGVGGLRVREAARGGGEVE